MRKREVGRESRMERAADWVYGIAAVMLLGSAAIQAIAEGTYQKYLKLFLGLVLILTVISPVLSLFGRSDAPSLYYLRESIASWLEGGGPEAAGGFGRAGSVPADWEQTVNRKREEALSQPLCVLAENYGFYLLSYSVRWSGEGRLDGIVLTVCQKTAREETQPAGRSGEEIPGTDRVETVRPVEAVGEGEIDSSYYEPSELRLLHQALETVLELSGEQVTIYLDREEERCARAVFHGKVYGRIWEPADGYFCWPRGFYLW